ncbi:MAG: PHP domain-containing protein [Gemmatimonadaceae bacterium]
MPPTKREPAAAAEHAGKPSRRRLLARVPWWPIVLSLIVILTAAGARRPVRDAGTLADVSEAYLVKSSGYVALGPLSAVLDTIALISARQHIAMLAGLLALLALYQATRHVRGRATWRSHFVALAWFLAVFIVSYVAAVILPRPMAYLASREPNIMRVDFHSHTSASRDARRGFGVEDNRNWHRRAGYDVAFITDHGTVAGAERGLANNTPSGLDEPVLLQSIEVTWTGEHVSIPGAQRTYTGVLTENLRDVDPQALRLASLVAAREPIVVWHHPRDLNRLPPAAGPRTAGIRAIEIANGSPDNMDDVEPKRAQIVAFAQRHDFALTTGTDNHGWGYTAPAWTLMRLPTWRGLGGDELTLLIERVIRELGFGGTLAIERVVEYPENGAELALTVVTVPLMMFRTLATDERMMWLLWIWAVWGIIRWATQRRARA